MYCCYCGPCVHNVVHYKISADYKSLIERMMDNYKESVHYNAYKGLIERMMDDYKESVH